MVDELLDAIEVEVVVEAELEEEVEVDIIEVGAAEMELLLEVVLGIAGTGVEVAVVFTPGAAAR